MLRCFACLVSLLSIATPATGASPSVGSGPAAVALRALEDTLGRGRLEAFDEVYAPDFVGHVGTTDYGAAEKLAVVREWRRAVPDLTVVVERIVADGELVEVTWTARGTQSGPAFGLPASGQRVEVCGMSLFRLAGGKIAEEWQALDEAGLLARAGLLPARTPPGQASEADVAAVRALFDDGLSRGRWDVFQAVHAKDFVAHVGTRSASAREDLESARQLRSDTPDLSVTIDRLLVSGDRIGVMYTARGTHTRPWHGVAPTGKAFSARGLVIFRMAGGQIAEEWGMPDTAALMRAFGLMPGEPRHL